MNLRGQPLISVVVCTFNRPDMLRLCVESFTLQTCPLDIFEVIVVNNNSTDEPRHVIDKYVAALPNLRWVLERSQGLSCARNKGCEEARGEYLAYVDDDAIVPPEYLANVTAVIERHEPDIVGGPIYPFYTSRKPKWFKDEYEVRKYADKSGFSRTCSVSGGNFIIRKSLLHQLGGFDVNYGMTGNTIGMLEERKILESYRARTAPEQQRTYYALECAIKHHVPDYKMRLSYMVKRQFIAGKSFCYLQTETGKLNESERLTPFSGVCNCLKSVPGLLFLVWTEMRSKGPWSADYVKCLVAQAWRLGYDWAQLSHARKASASDVPAQRVSTAK